MKRITVVLLLLVVFAASAVLLFLRPTPHPLTAGAYRLALYTDPDPVELGQDAVLRVALSDRGGEPVSGCALRFSQEMPGMEMSHDGVSTSMAEKGDSGVYTARSRQFTMGGDWQLKFELECPGGAPATAAYSFNIPWPE